MSDIASAQKLKQSSPQLPVSWYFDQQMLELEQKLLFENGPGYVGHELMVPNEGDYHSLAWMDHAKLLIRNAQGVELLSNVCRHRQAIMLEGRGNARNIVCPLHRWTYNTRGELLGAPHFPDNPCLNLPKTPLQNWNGLLFAGKRDIAQDLGSLRERADLDFSGYMLDRVEVHECNYNWKTFIEVYLEDYHVVPFHPGLGNFVTCDDLEWQFGPRHSVQTVGLNNRLAKARQHDLRALAQGGARLLPGRDSAPRRDLAHALSEHHDRVVSACAGGEHRAPARTPIDHQRGRVLLSGGRGPVRTRIRRGRAGGLLGDRDRG